MKRTLAVVLIVLLIVSFFTVVDVAATSGMDQKSVDKPAHAKKIKDEQKLDKKPAKVKKIHKVKAN